MLSNDAIQSVNRRIADPVQCLSDGVIITIIAFACHSVCLFNPLYLNSEISERDALSNCVQVMFNDSQGVLTHFNGLEELIRQRGGLEAFSSNPVVRTVIFWYVSFP